MYASQQSIKINQPAANRAQSDIWTHPIRFHISRWQLSSPIRISANVQPVGMIILSYGVSARDAE